MRKETVSLMCKRLKLLGIKDEVTQMALKNPEKAIEFIHGQYLAADRETNGISQS